MRLLISLAEILCFGFANAQQQLTAITCYAGGKLFTIPALAKQQSLDSAPATQIQLKLTGKPIIPPYQIQTAISFAVWKMP